jgi:hypothetical protein
MAAAAVALAAPALLGVVMMEIPRILRPGDSIAVETTLDHVLLWMFTWGVIVALLSYPPSVAVCALAAYALWRNGVSERWTRVSVICALVTVAAIALITFRAIEARQSTERWLRRSGVTGWSFAEQPGTSLTKRPGT